MSVFFVLMLRLPPRSPLFPYTTLFRSLLPDQRHPGPPAVAARSSRRRPAARGALRRKVRGADEEADHRDLESRARLPAVACLDRKSTRLNSSHLGISYAVFCLKKKKKK